MARAAARSTDCYDPELEGAAERRAAELLRSCVNADEWETYRDLGFINVRGRAGGGLGAAAAAAGAGYAYLIYPYRPIVAYVPTTRRLLGEYCVAFDDAPGGGRRLPPSDDVLAKWLALIADERRLIESANVHPIGRRLDPLRVRRDLAALASRGSTSPSSPPLAG